MALRIVTEPTQLTVVDPEFTLTVVSPTPARLYASPVGPQGIPGVPGPTGPAGPQGEAWLPDFFESSTQPLDPKQGDQWIVKNQLEGN